MISDHPGQSVGPRTYCRLIRPIGRWRPNSARNGRNPEQMANIPILFLYESSYARFATPRRSIQMRSKHRHSAYADTINTPAPAAGTGQFKSWLGDFTCE